MKPIASLMLVLAVAFRSFLPVSSTAFIENSSFQTIEDLFLLNDMLMPLDSPNGSSNPGEPPIPGYNETSEYLIGSVAVGIVFLESNGTIDWQTENWTTTEESQVVSEITTGLSWWAGQNPNASVSLTYDIYYGVPTSYEPINHPSTDEGLWISDAMAFLGYSGSDYFMQVLDYINALRNNLNPDWAFAMFIVDSSNDLDGSFTNGLSAYAYLGGPFTVMTYDNGGYGVNNMDYVSAHEAGHIFYATDEYDGVTEYSGYLNISDVDGSSGLMDAPLSWFLSTGTWGQVGWRDTDGDGIQDIVDTFPMTMLDPYSPDPTTETVLIYNGWVTEVPYPNMNPYGTGRNVTINTIANVEYRVDGGPWISANATDGAFDEAVENFTFTTPPLSLGTHIIETRGINSVGNVEIWYSSDEITIIGFPNANFTYSPEAPIVNETVTFDASASTPNGGYIVSYKWNFGDGTPIVTETDPIITHNYTATGTYNVTLTVTDSEGLSDITWKSVVVPAQFTLLTLYTLNLYVDIYIQEGILKVRFYSYSNVYEGEVTVWTGTTPDHVVLSVNVSHPLNWPIENATLVLTDDLGNIIQTVTSFLVGRSHVFSRLTEIDTIWPYASPEERITLFQEIIDIDIQWPYAPP